MEGIFVPSSADLLKLRSSALSTISLCSYGCVCVSVAYVQDLIFLALNCRPNDTKERRKKLPDLIVSGLSEKQLRCKLKDHGLSWKGDKKVS